MTRRRTPKDSAEHKANVQRINLQKHQEGERRKKWAGAKRRKGKSRAGTNGEPFHQIETLLKQSAWKKARGLIHEALVFHPSHHWLWMMLSSTYYEDREYVKALKAAEHAVQLQPQCALALWHYAGALTMTRHETAALAIYSTIKNIDLEEIAYGDHGEGMNWAMQLDNDVSFCMGSLYHWLSDDDHAKPCFEKYLHNRRHGVTSIYDKKEAEKYLADIEKPAAKKKISS